MFGFRPDGVRLKGIDPIQRIIPHIMPKRYDAQNMVHRDIPCEPMDSFIKAQRAAGDSYNYMHLFVAASVRTYAHYPRLNRFVMNGRIYARKSIGVSFVVKKSLSVTASDSLVKLEFTGHESIKEIRDKMNEAIRANSTRDANNSTDKLARLLTFTPNFVLKILVKTALWLDKHGMLPAPVIKASPFHTSFFLTNMKSINGPSIYHHIYDVGTTGIFVSMGKLNPSPKTMPLDIVMDERFCDGFYFVKVLAEMERLLAEPDELLERQEELPEDVEVEDRHRYRLFSRKQA